MLNVQSCFGLDKDGPHEDTPEGQRRLKVTVSRYVCLLMAAFFMTCEEGVESVRSVTLTLALADAEQTPEALELSRLEFALRAVSLEHVESGETLALDGGRIAYALGQGQIEAVLATMAPLRPGTWQVTLDVGALDVSPEGETLELVGWYIAPHHDGPTPLPRRLMPLRQCLASERYPFAYTSDGRATLVLPPLRVEGSEAALVVALPIAAWLHEVVLPAAWDALVAQMVECLAEETCTPRGEDHRPEPESECGALLRPPEGIRADVRDLAGVGLERFERSLLRYRSTR